MGKPPESARQPEQRPARAPCQTGCLAGADVRGWITTIAQRRRLGLSDEAAYTRAWLSIVDVNPFPAILGRICPHPCEAGCNRSAKEGPVSVHRLERFVGDWALARGLSFRRIEEDSKPESIGVIGSGPAGLSFAYQMVRRGYRVTVYESSRAPGGMLRHGVPEYRLPRGVLDAEIDRILDLGAELRAGVRIGRDLSLAELESKHDVVFLGIGAHAGLSLGISGDAGPGVWSATDYLRRVNAGERIDAGDRVVVVGGGNTAIDAARTARRLGATVTVVYRRTRAEMPARGEEVDEAREEGVAFEFLAAPVRIERSDGTVRALIVQRMRLGEPDESGRRRPLPEPGAVRELETDAVIAALSQRPDWGTLQVSRTDEGWARPDGLGRLNDAMWTAGDAVRLGPAGLAIGRARLAAETIHASLRGLPLPQRLETTTPAGPDVKPEYYPDRPRVAPEVLAPERRLERPGEEVHGGLTETQFHRELERCMSCGSCFGCEHCWIYCVHDCFSRVEEVRPGSYFSLAVDACQACGKCVDVCPCGFLRIRDRTADA